MAINYKDMKKNKLPQLNSAAPTNVANPVTSNLAIKKAAPTTSALPTVKPTVGVTDPQTPLVTAQESKLPKVAPVMDVTDPQTPIKTVEATPLPPKTVAPMEQTTTTPEVGYKTTDIGQQAMDKFSQRALAEEDPQVAAERQRLERNSVLMEQKARREGHDRAVQAGYRPGSPQYEQMLTQSVSNARNANIQAMNSFNDFARSRRADQQRELEGLLSGEFSRVGVQQSRDVQDFNNLVKFLPSDKAQQMLAVANAKGMDLTSAMSGMYDMSGNLKGEFQDMSKPELVKQGIEQSVDQMNTNPDTGEAWKGTEKSDYIDKFYSDNFQNLLFPSETQTEQVTEKKASKESVEKALESGDLGDLAPEDWANMTTSQRKDAKEKGLITEFDSTSNKGDNWSDLDNMNTSDATSYWLSNNPISAPENKGKIVEKDGVLYEIIEPMRVIDEGGDNKRIAVIARPVGGGAEQQIHRSSRFEGTVTGMATDAAKEYGPGLLSPGFGASGASLLPKLPF